MRSLATLAGAVAVAAFAAAIAGAQAGASRAPDCATRNLVLWLDTNGDAGAGSVHYELELTNLSGRSCVLRGYPGVSAVDLAGRQLGSPAAREAGSPVRSIVVAPGGSASAALRIANTGVFPSTSCRSTTAAGLRVYPPNQTASKVVHYPVGACTRSGVTYLHVKAVTAANRP